MDPYQRRRSMAGSCPYGGFFQSCATGFKGCCLVDACTNGCPAGKDRTEDFTAPSGTSRESVPTSTGDLILASIATSTGTSSSATAATSSPAPTASVSSITGDVITSTSAEQTVYVTKNQQWTTSSAPSSIVSEQPAHRDHAFPVAAIVGGALGGIIALIALAIFACFYMKMKKRKIYQSPEYPSPLIGSDMSEHLRGMYQIDSRAISCVH